MASSKPKTFKHTKNKRKKEQILEDADDYLAAAIEDEDAMGKHRGGDAPKSLRFARKALDLYAQGLAKYPRNFDLAYNKARLELEVATHPTLVKVLDVPLLNLLHQSLLSHQHALSIDPENADILFNSAQVLTSLAELIAKDDNLSDTEALKYLETALEYQERCLQIQEVKFTESRRMQEEAASHTFDSEEDEGGGAKIDSNTTTAFEDREEEEQWVSVVEPVTANTLLDTVLAQIATLTALCSIIISSLASSPMYQPAISLPWIETYSTKLINDELANLARLQDLQPRASEAAFTKATLAANLLELAYRSNSINIDIYKKELEAVYASLELDQTSSEVLLAQSQALIAFSDALSDSLRRDLASEGNIRWNALSKAQKTLTIAAGLPSIDQSSLAKSHLLRGDVSLLLQNLSQPPILFPQAVSNRSQLLKNAEVFYRNATKLFGSLGNDGLEEKEVAEFRGGVVTVLQATLAQSSSKGDVVNGQTVMEPAKAGTILKAVSSAKTNEWRRDQFQDMVDEGLVSESLFSL